MSEQNQKAVDEINSIINIIKPELLSFNKTYSIMRTVKMLVYYTSLIAIITIAFQNKQNFRYDKYRMNVDKFINSRNID